MNKEELNNVLDLIKKDKVQEANEVFEKIVPVETVDYFMVKGKLEQKFQKWGNATNAYLKVVELEPDNMEAKNNLLIIKNILNFWNPEMFNP